MATLETQERFTKLYKEVKEELSKVLPLGQCINAEPRYFKSIRALGRCNRKIIGDKYPIFTIFLNEYLENCKDQTIKNTIAHELIHTIKGCFDHKTYFKYYASKIAQYGYTVARTTRDTDFREFCNNLRNGKQGNKKHHIYKVTCLECGRSVLRERRINVNNYICPACHGHLKIEEV